LTALNTSLIFSATLSDDSKAKHPSPRAKKTTKTKKMEKMKEQNKKFETGSLDTGFQAFWL
jgi:hypothetical protein